jgi:hypothetical protein
MTKKELIDAIFKFSAVVILLAALFVYHNAPQANRYKYKAPDSGSIAYEIFDTHTGKLYTLAELDKGSGWVIFEPGKQPERFGTWRDSKPSQPKANDPTK